MSKKKKPYINSLLSVLQSRYEFEDVVHFLESVLCRAVNSDDFFRYYVSNQVICEYPVVHKDLDNGKTTN
ncbi:MAG: hypothetical protein K2F89_09610 [Treponemataceae bacterium]|nr:hypothetical protein [Treponemataceae bacterium]